jgi:hypothetical protein
VNTWKVILATIVIWCAGVVTGGLLVSYSGRPLFDGHQPASRPSGPAPWLAPGKEITHHGEGELQSSFDRLRGEFLVHATRELKLSHEQHERIEKIIRESQESSRKIWEPIAPQMRQNLAETKEKILAELTPDQRARFEELLKQQQRPRRSGEPAPPGRGPRGQQPPSPTPGGSPAKVAPPEVAPQPTSPAPQPQNP